MQSSKKRQFTRSPGIDTLAAANGMQEKEANKVYYCIMLLLVLYYKKDCSN